MTIGHDTYVYGPVGGLYHWRCLTCDATSDPKGFRRRMDADIDAEAHEA